jgi:tripartite-type tricarboxylate transporter receptor subunit TctC
MTLYFVLDMSLQMKRFCTKPRKTIALFALLFCLNTTAVGFAQTEPYYQGKTIRIIVGFSAGGLTDQWARMFARSMPKFIPGNPNIIVQNMPGASSVVASNFVYGVAKPDGLTVGIPNSSLYLTQLTGRKEVKFDVRKFEWIGTQEKWTQMIYFRADTPFKTIGDIIKAKEPPKCGASGFASSGYILPRVLEETFGAKFNIIVGYAGGKEIDLAVEKGEVVCRGHDISSHFGREPFNTWHKTRYDRHLVQDARTRDPRLPETPTIWEIMNEYKTPQVSRSVAETILTANDFGRAMMAPPATPPELVKLLRSAYAQALKDPELLAEAKKSSLDVDYTPGEQLQKLARDVMDQSPDVVDRVKKILGE